MLYFQKLTLDNFLLTPNCTQKNLLQMNLEYLLDLELNRVPQMTYALFEKAIERLTNLEKFSVSNCPEMLTNDFLRKIFEHMGKLETLILDNSNRVSLFTLIEQLFHCYW
jgi:hypothetical protein